MRLSSWATRAAAELGPRNHCYPAKLSQNLKKIGDFLITNYAVPGFTSADANRLFREVIRPKSPEYLIIYLGNNEAAVSVRKGYFNPLNARWTAVSSWPRRRPFRPILSAPRFQFSYNVSPSDYATSPAEFHANLSFIARSAYRSGIRTLIINPVANSRFPCGVGTLNSTYMAYLDDLDDVGYEPKNNPIDTDSDKIAMGLEQFIAGRWEAAIDVWEAVTTREDVAGFITRHNIACAQIRLGHPSGEMALESLHGVYPTYDSTVLYNLSHAKRMRGDDEIARILLAKALDSDRSTYRIRPAYRDAIARLTSLPGVRIVDLNAALTPNHFIDYCHPTDDGHDVIARILTDLIRSDQTAPPRPGTTSYTVVLPTPNYATEPKKSLIDYYSIERPIERRTMERLIRKTDRTMPAATGDLAQFFACIDNFFIVNERHPVFTGIMNMTDTWLPMAHEILSFPEFYLYRILHNYFREFERRIPFLDRDLVAAVSGTVFSASDYAGMIFRKGTDPLEMELDFRHDYGIAILAKVKRELEESDTIYRPTIGTRIRTITTWYTREAFRYGTHSRRSMLYACWDIERVIEGLIVTLVIADQAKRENLRYHIERILWSVLALIAVHERHVTSFLSEGRDFSITAYEAELAETRRTIGETLSMAPTFERPDPSQPLEN